MLKGRGRDPRTAGAAPAQLGARLPATPAHLAMRTATLPRAPLAKPEPDYEVVEFPSDQYVNAKLQPPPPPPPRPPTGHPAEAASCGLCGGGGARVRCAECGRRALCASCDDMYHRHPKRRHHQRQALSLNQIMRDERPPLPPKGTPPVPPPRRHKMSGDRMSASPRPPSATPDQRHALAQPALHTQTMPNSRVTSQSGQQMPAHLQARFQAAGYLPPAAAGHAPTSLSHAPATLGHAPAASNHAPAGWQRPRNSLPGFNMPPNVVMAQDGWEGAAPGGGWGRPLRRGASVLELGAPACGCGPCAPWRYGSCASLDHQGPQMWGAPGWAPPCCAPHAPAHAHQPYTPQPYRRADSRGVSRAASRAGSRAASPAPSGRSRASRRRPRSRSPPPLPSSDADSESDSEPDRPAHKEHHSLPLPARSTAPAKPQSPPPEVPRPAPAPVPAAPAAPVARAAWQCEHCTFVNEPGVRVCAVCCRTPSAAPNELAAAHQPEPEQPPSEPSVAESARGLERLHIDEAPPARPVQNDFRNGESTRVILKNERTSTGCGPSPPREENIRKHNNRLVTPSREPSVESTRHDMAVGASPPREVQRMSVARSPPRQNAATRASPYKEAPTRHSISVGPSPPREAPARPSPVQKKSAGTSPPRERVIESRASSTRARANVSNTGTSPPPQSISTQTYEAPSTWERAPSAARSRARRRRDDTRRERSHSRHSLSSDTRESERSARTSGGGGRWEWRDSSPGAEWSGSERRPPRLARRASHLDLRRDAPPPRRRASCYRDEVASPEPSRAMSLEALASRGASAAAERGLELARLMADAERLGFSAAEVQAALAQSPAAPLAWLRARWPSLCAGVRAAAARLEPRARVTEQEARAALARHRGAMWPAVTDCVERHRRQEKESVPRQHGGRVWGSPAGADDDAAPPRGPRAEDSSDEFDGPPPAALRDDDWMYLPLDAGPKGRGSVDADAWGAPPAEAAYREVASDVALELSRLLVQAGVPATTDDLIINGLLPPAQVTPAEEARIIGKPNSIDFIQSENDFIDAYNALTRSTPLPSVDDQPESVNQLLEKDSKRDMYDVSEKHSSSNIKNTTVNTINYNKPLISTPELSLDPTNVQTIDVQQKPTSTTYSSNDFPTQEQPSTSSPNQQKVPEKQKTPDSTTQIQNHMSEPKEERQPNLNLEPNQSFEEPLFIESTVSYSVEENLSTKDELSNLGTNQTSSSNQVVDKTSNLNDIVGNTQRLIQQMKDEINSDINYIDSNNTSQSEPDSSSNESDISSEHESSYSDTEDKETDESESSDTENEANNLHKRRSTIIHRTSSEENDQFEEAMDHIEDQMEDFKNTNIEILDSIARSLQEEHILSVETAAAPTPIINNEKEQDVNNNLFVEVNSFEEIYAELNTNTKNRAHLNNVNKTHYDRPQLDSKQRESQQTSSSKASLTLSNLNSTAPIQQIVPEDSRNVSNIVRENIDVDFVDASENNYHDHSYEENIIGNTIKEPNNEISIDGPLHSSDDEGSSDSSDSDASDGTSSEKNNVSKNVNTPVIENFITNGQIPSTNNSTNYNNGEGTMSKINILQDNFIERNTTNDNNNTSQSKEATAETSIVQESDVDVVDDNYVEQDTEIQDNLGQQIIQMYNDNLEHNRVMEKTIVQNIENIQETIASEDNHQSAETKPIPEDNVVNNIDQNTTVTLQNITVEDVTESNDAIKNNIEQNPVPEHARDSQGSNEIIEIHPKDTKTEQSVTNQITNGANDNKKSPSRSPPKTPTDVGPSKAFITNKSNIPKLVKVGQNKQKGDKTAPKVVASKVPVRKASLKQYPAPTPPKAHFGNVQSGHVKQLQTRLFNNKFPKTVVNVPDVVDVKPSTSTMHKKKPAPPPPTLEQKQVPLAKVSPPKEKKSSFFRESCRTEDEWTESEAEDAPTPAPRESQEPPRPATPPPPVTVRRVSGQIIDLARVRLPEGSPERQARMLLAEGATETWEQARLAVELVSRGTEPPAALLAALECADLSAALAYLQQDCELCAERLPEHEMVSMLRCTHRCCRECARLYFTVQITERSIADCVCPYCKEPDLENTPEDAWLEYFAHLDILLKTMLETDVHELFQRKLRDRTLARDPNFRWCMECSSGFFVHPKQKKIRCPECRSVSCAKCRKTWSVNHEGLSCEQYAAWLEDNDPERSLAAVQQHLRENGLECPRCRFKYSLSRGGCMHFTCTQCKYEFCYGCGKPFMMGARCGLSEYCAKLGLHAHHPRNCLFYLRDKEPHELQTLLQMNNVSYETEAPEGSTGRCPVQLQRETPAGLVDGGCGHDAPPNHAGLCKPHYVEYLAARARALDPIPIMDVAELVAELRRRALPLPERGPWDTDPIYAGMCAEIVKEKIPLD